MTKKNFNINENNTAEEAIAIIREAIAEMPLFKTKAQKQVLNTLKAIVKNHQMNKSTVCQAAIDKLTVSQSIAAMRNYNLYR